MNLAWTQHLKDPQDKAKFEAQVKTAKPVLDRLAQLIQDKENSLTILELSPTSFEIPNWELKQAYNIGFRSFANGMKKLVDIDQNNKGR